jgi:decaprenyl-phosphate phosphoribosyltransferase
MMGTLPNNLPLSIAGDARMPLRRQLRYRRLRATLTTMRPRQWVKNLLVVSAPAAAGVLGSGAVLARVAVTAIGFCLLASGTYAINDVADAAEDRLHPQKCRRPVASGELEASTSMLLGLGLMTVGICLCAMVGPLVAVVGFAYLVSTLSYTMVWRKVVLLDVAFVASGFVLRALAGAAAASVPASRSFLAVITFVAILIAGGKRRAELRRAPGNVRRRVLERYSLGRLRLIMLSSAALAFCAYAVWVLQLPTVAGVPWRPLTIVPFAATMLRYNQLVGAGHGEAPEELLRDRYLMLAAVMWLAVFALGVQAATG